VDKTTSRLKNHQYSDGDYAMSFDMPVGIVCPYPAQIAPLTSSRNDLWDNSSCSGTTAAAAKNIDGVPVNNIEAQGWMLCDGRWLDTNSYTELYAVLGGLYGERDNNNIQQFRIPDYRGLFLRGFDANAGMDPNAADRLSPQGKSAENCVGSLQCDALQDHVHRYNTSDPAGISQQGQAACITTTTKDTTSPQSPARVSKNETRPRNIATNYVIRFR
jgi:rhizosphere induced protein